MILFRPFFRVIRNDILLDLKPILYYLSAIKMQPRLCRPRDVLQASIITLITQV